MATPNHALAAAEPPQLSYQGVGWTQADLATDPPVATVEGSDAHGAAALAFCRSWLRGDNTFLVHTSGSTGEPKPIALTRAQLEASAMATGQALGLTAGDRALVCLPTQYIAGRMMLVRGLVLKLPMELVAPAADPFAGLAPGAAFAFAAFVPLQLQTLLDVALLASSDSCFPEDIAGAFRYRRLLDGMKAILVGGAPVNPTLENQIRQLSAPVYHTYGMTETATHVALRRLNGPDASPLFHPLPGVVTGVDARGCLHVAGPMTAGAVVQTNDLVQLEVDGAFRWLGRWDNVLNSGGVKVHVEAVEAAVARLAAEQRELGLARRRFFVAGTPDPRLGQVVTLFVEGTPLAADQEEQLRWAVAQELERFQAPRLVRYIARFAETPTGKVDRGATLTQVTGDR